MAERFATPSFRPLRAGLFVALGCFGVFPYLHFASLEGWSAVSAQLRPDIMLPMGGIYIFGALLYGARFPECLHPAALTSWVNLTRFSISWLSLQPFFT